MASDQNFQELEEECIRQANVCPHWLPDGDAFWYMSINSSGASRFIFVDCIKGVRQAAFDHSGLATELAKRTQQRIDARNLPFWWLNVARDASWIRFQLDEQTWQYSQDGTLQLWHGELDQGNFDFGCEEKASPWSHESIILSLANYTSKTITYSWIDNEGEPRQFGSLTIGQVKTQQSYVGHIWRLAAQDSDRSISFSVKTGISTAHIEELSDRLILRWEMDTLAESSNTKDSEPTTISTRRPEVFVRDFNVWLRNADGTESQISYGGFVDNAFKDDCIYLSSTGQHAVVWQCRPQTKRVVHMVESTPKDQFQPKLSTAEYLKPGDNVDVYRPRLFDLTSGREIPVNDNLFRNPYALTNVGWSQDGKKYRFVFNERGHQNLRLLEIDSSGGVNALVEESSNTFIDYHHKLYHGVFEARGEIIWASERDGFNHLYLYDLENGKLKNQITKGNWVVRSVELIDEETGVIWFRGLGMVPGQDPYYAHLACVQFDGSNFRIVTKGEGTHSWKWSPNKQYLLDSWSRVDFPPNTVVRKAQTGELVVELEQSQLNRLLEVGWVSPDIFVATGRDGETSIHGIILRPADFNPSLRYPILEQIYAGPQDYYTPKAFQTLPKLRQRADQGYILVVLDGMGTNWRSKEFHDVCYKNLKDAGFSDRIAWITAAAKTRPWMDISRVGCYGASAGGQNAAAAVIHHGQFYKAACALAGCHDNRMDKLWWNELWMGYPVDESYEKSSNVTHAQKIQGQLMLAVGELDANVDPSSTMKLVHALIEAEKDFELVYIPGAGHQISAHPHVVRKQNDFFRRHLKEL
ncbi:hypothetical protein JX265_005841 [Neoarthrinium moseri]|uniref:Probable dipeptidyl-aminopeptidase B n=1 Tax=Neoarthrinium moseri TaxID=1658444 RepID=A0A9P9WN85_9PEZI|nr:hypothetical protein JX265_005841 [Neoarthrinium moseri]